MGRSSSWVVAGLFVSTAPALIWPPRAFDPAHFLKGAHALLALNLPLPVKTGRGGGAALHPAECHGMLANVELGESVQWNEEGDMALKVEMHVDPNSAREQQQRAREEEA